MLLALNYFSTSYIHAYKKHGLFWIYISTTNQWFFHLAILILLSNQLWHTRSQLTGLKTLCLCSNFEFYNHIYVPLSHLKLKGKASVFNIALVLEDITTLNCVSNTLRSYVRICYVHICYVHSFIMYPSDFRDIQ